MATENSKLIFGLAPRHYADLVNVFDQHPSIEKVMIFGSRAKGTAKTNSDFDLAILAPTMSAEEFSKLWSELTDLPLIFKMDVIHWDQINNSKFKEKIIREGKVFYPLANPAKGNC
ncbi:MAG: nucleotidyltransferase domain-containing protein [Gammaproteobacteria bacterium]